MLHQPVLLKEVIAGLAIKTDGIYIDGTFGRGGHSREILNTLNERGQLLLIDKDPQAISYAEKNFGIDKRIKIAQGSFTQILGLTEKYAWKGRVNGVLLDLGVSSPQLDEAQRGFSFLRDGPLDMRMDSTTGIDAATWINAARAEEIADVLFQYGEERYSRRIAAAIVQARKVQAIKTTGVLAEIVAKAHPHWEKHKHPATRTFQAIRIFINSELDDLAMGLEQAMQVLSPEGRLVVISFHSLEDRLVKRFMHRQSKGNELPAGLPIVHHTIKKNLRRVGRAIRASEEEIALNPRARSAILRIAEKLS